MKRLFKALLRKKRAKESWFKYMMSVLHLWLGLLSSIVVFFVCLSGSIYAFKDKIIDAWNYDKIFIQAEKEAALPVDSIQKILQTKGLEMTHVLIPEANNKSISVSYKNTKTSVIGSFYVNPYTGKILGSGDYSLKSFFDFILDVHRSLLINKVGKQIVGASILMFVFLLFSGFILWLPKKLKNIKNGLLIRWKARFYRLNYDLHNILGFYSLLLLLLISLTGLYVSYGWVKSGIIVALGGEPVLSAHADESAQEEISNSFEDMLAEMIETEEDKILLKEEKPASLDSILTLANTHLSYKAITSVNLPDDENPNFRIKKINRENFLGALLPDLITFNKKGELRSVERFLDKPLHKQFVEISLPLHTGEILGWPSIILYALVALIGCSLPVTGFIIWWKKAS